MDQPGTNDYVCKCAPGYSGKRCEYLTSLSFLHNASYVELEPLNVKPAANVTITFATEQEDGVLLYYGDYQHLAVELFKYDKFKKKYNFCLNFRQLCCKS